MLKHVLVPLDGSTLADEALAHAEAIVDPQGTVTLVTAVEVSTVPSYGPEMIPMVRTAVPNYAEAMDNQIPLAQVYLQRIADTLHARGLNVEYDARLGDPATVIVEVARERDVDAIVISTHGRSGFGRFLFGSVTTKVLETANRPVFVIPSGYRRVVGKTTAVADAAPVTT